MKTGSRTPILYKAVDVPMRDLFLALRRFTRLLLSFGLFAIFSILPASSSAITLYVSKIGNDNASGASLQSSDSTGPLATIGHAVEKLAEFRKQNPVSPEPLEIAIDPGVYRINKTIRIPAELSGKSNAPFKIFAIRPGTVWINGGRSLLNPRALRTEERANLSQTAADHVKVYDLGGTDVPVFGIAKRGFSSDLFLDHRPMSIARWPKSGFARIANALDGKDGLRFKVDHASPNDWSKENDLWAMGYWYYNWAEEYFPVKVNGSVVSLPSKHNYGMRAKQPVFFLNVLAELDRPGEWYLDAPGKKIYFWAPEGSDATSLELSATEELMRIDGASFVTIDGINFELARGPAITIKDGKNNYIRSCEIRNVGGLAVRITGENSGVSNCQIHDVGAGGISLDGGNRRTLKPGHLIASRNHIYNFNRWNRTYRPAINLGGVGNSAVNNRIHDAPHVAIMLNGNDHLIELNEVYNVVQESSDAGAIYMGRDWTQRGNIIRHNFLHDIRRPEDGDTNGIYLDDQFSGTEIFGNVFYRVNNPVFIGGGRDNTVSNNIFVESSPAVRIDQRGIGWRAKQVDDPKGDIRQNLMAVPFDGPAYAKYRNLGNILDDQPGMAKYNGMSNNIILRSKCFDKMGGDAPLERSGDVCDPNSQFFLFGAGTAVKATDFVISKTFRQVPSGFSSIPLEKIGIK